jgi:hypothetical protein
MKTLAAWRSHAPRFANSHWLVLNETPSPDDATPIFVLIEADEGADAGTHEGKKTGRESCAK